MSKWKTSCRYLLAKVCLDRSNQTMRATHTIGGWAMQSGRIPKNSWQRLQLASYTKFGSVSRCKDGNRSSVWRQAVSSFKVTLHNTKEYRIPGKIANYPGLMIKIKIPAGGSWPWQSPGDPHHIDPEGPNWWDIDPALRALKCYVALHPPPYAQRKFDLLVLKFYQHFCSTTFWFLKK